MALNLKSISELPVIASTINSQIAALSSTAATADIEVSFKNSTTELSSYKFSFGQFVKYLVDQLTALSNNFANYLPLTAYNDKTTEMFKHLSDDFLPNNYVYTASKDQTQYIYGRKNFYVTDSSDKNTTFSTPVKIDSTATIDSLTAESLKCTTDPAELTAHYARWN